VGSALPPSRHLSRELGCSRWVVTESYAQLTAEGYLTARTGSATRVRWSGTTPDDPGPSTAPPPAPTPRPLDLAPGRPDTRAFPRTRWLAALRAELATASADELGFPDPQGHPRLRAVLAEYLVRSRGARLAPDDLRITTGVTDGVARLCRALAVSATTTSPSSSASSTAAPAIAVEDPGWPQLRAVVEAAGLRTVPIPVDEHGLRVDALRAAAASAAVAAAVDTSAASASSPIRAVILAPAHQFPTGSVLAPARRAQLLRWAEESDALILEDDYDSEFRYDRRPIGTLHGMAPERVALFGSVSKTLAPALGLGWYAAPERWRHADRAANPDAVRPPLLDQLALARFLSDGSYDRHLRTTRLSYRTRRDRLLTALQQTLPPGCTVSGAAAGLHLVLDLPPGTRTATVTAAAARLGIDITDLDRYRHPPDPTRPALVLGYGNLPDRSIPPAVTALGAALTSLPAATPHR
jgi:GntR family transcriptional regulator/MocR family aminotransferase